MPKKKKKKKRHLMAWQLKRKGLQSKLSTLLPSSWLFKTPSIEAVLLPETLS